MNDTKSKPVSIRLTVEESNAFDKIEKLTGKSKSDLIREKILSDSDKGEILDTILWESGEIQENIIKSIKSLFDDKEFIEIKLDSADKGNIYNYEKGYYIRNNKQVTVVVLKVDHTKREMLVALAPFVKIPKATKIWKIVDEAQHVEAVFKPVL